MERITIGVCTAIALRCVVHDILHTLPNIWRYVSRLCGTCMHRRLCLLKMKLPIVD